MRTDLTFIALVFVSVIWEATLGVPYQWWTYREDEMLGIFVTAWANLPLEANILQMTIMASSMPFVGRG